MKWLYALALILGLYAPAYCQDIGIGDSLAIGIIQAGGLEGIGRVGASPSAVYQMVRNYSAEGLRDAVVILSCGASNNPDQIEFCLKDMDVLKLAGARIVLLGVGSSLPNSVEINKLLEAYAQVEDAIFVWGWEDIHPRDYGYVFRFIREQECKWWKVCPV